MSDERRRFFRVEDIIGLKAEIIERSQIDQRLESFWQQQHQYSLLNEFNFQLEQHQADLRHIKEKLPEVGRYLEVLQKQLDTLSDRILSGEDDFVEQEKTVNISAQGIAFFSDEAVHEGEIVELHLQLFPEKHKIVTFAKVIECSRSTHELGQFKISLDFEHIHDADRELLVKHVHGKQMRALGAARFEEDPQ